MCVSYLSLTTLLWCVSSWSLYHLTHDLQKTEVLLQSSCFLAFLSIALKNHHEGFALNLQDFKNCFQILEVVSVLFMNKPNNFVHCLYLTLEEEKQWGFIMVIIYFSFIFLTSQHKNVGKLSFREHHQPFILNYMSRWIDLQPKQSWGSRLVDWLSTEDVTGLMVKEPYHF